MIENWEKRKGGSPPVQRLDPRPKVTQETRFTVLDGLLELESLVQSFRSVSGANEVEKLGPQRLTSDQLMKVG